MRHENLIAYGFAVAIVSALGSYALYAMVPSLAETTAKSGLPPKTNDGCDLSERQIRELWVSALPGVGAPVGERERITALLIKGAEDLCRSVRGPTVPLPPELQRR